ncbi:MAG: GspE/PulE/PilB domain-containing protein [Limisphaerales bacterium]
MQAKLNPGEEGQLRQTVEMFEVITQTQPLDYQSLDILKEAYLKLGMDNEVVATCRRIASAYVQLGQLSSAIMEYETILQRIPDDPEATIAIKQLSSRAEKLNKPDAPEPEINKSGKPAVPGQLDDGKAVMRKIFVEGKLITDVAFETNWPKVGPQDTPAKPIEPFVHTLAEKELAPLEKSLRIISDRSRVPFIPIGRYDLDIELTRTFPRAMCLRWCMLPFDRMSKSLLVGTANPFNKQAMAEMEQAAKCHIVWYLVPPLDLMKTLAKAFR